MRLFSRIQHYFHKRFLAKQPLPPKRALLNRAAIKTVGILFDATNLEQAQQILRYRNQLEKEGKRVKLLAYINSRAKDIEANYPFFLRSDVNWKYIPNGQAVDDFMSVSFDLLLVVSSISTPSFEYISTLTDARLKVGPDSENRQAYDLMLDISAHHTPEQIIQLMENYLKVVLPKQQMTKKQLATA